MAGGGGRTHMDNGHLGGGDEALSNTKGEPCQPDGRRKSTTNISSGGKVRTGKEGYIPYSGNPFPSRKDASSSSSSNLSFFPVN